MWVNKVELLRQYGTMRGNQSMIFPKESPLLPFFKYVYNKIRQNGALHRIKKKWVDIEYRSTCQSSPLQPISFHKIVSLFTLLFFGMCWTFIILVIEVYSKKKVSNMQSIDVHVVKPVHAEIGVQKGARLCSNCACELRHC